MALPSKVVDQLSRAPARTPGWSSRVLLFSATFFILSLAIFFGIQYGYGPFLENQMDRIDREIDEFSKQVPQRQQDELISFYSQLDNMSTLLARQTMPSKVFGWLEENTNVNAQLLSLAFNSTNRTVMISGQVRSIVTLGEQLNRFRVQPFVRNVQLTQLALDQKVGAWTFSITLTMDPQFFAPTAITVEDLPQGGEFIDSSGASSDSSVPISASSTVAASSTTSSQ